MKSKILILLLIFVYNMKSNDRFEFINLLNIHNNPINEEHPNKFCFSDLGSWYGFALPEEKSFHPGFIGPYCFDSQKWVSNTLILFSVYDNQKKLIKDKAHVKSISYYPGLLEEIYTINNFKIRLILFFTETNRTIIRAEIQNLSKKERIIYTGWNGNSFQPILRQEKDKISFHTENSMGKIVFQNQNIIEFSPEKYRTISEYTDTLSYKESIAKTIFVTYKEKDDIKNHYNTLSVLQLIEKNQTRWNHYINRVLSEISPVFKEKQYKKLAVKALMTLIHNWRSPRGGLTEDGLFPSSSVDYFNGFWAWDSWKHSAALTFFAPELAKKQIQAMFDYQDSTGMIPDCIYADTVENNWRNTKPPLAAWAVWKIYEETKDTLFLKMFYRKLQKYHEWWHKNRDYDKDGLCEYGSTDGTLIAAKWESGMDNAARFDSSKMLQSSTNSWSINQESVDLNSYLYAEKTILAQIADILNSNEEKIKYTAEALDLKNKINQQMFDTQKEYYYDIHIKSGKFIYPKGPEGWTPLFTGAADEENAKKAIHTILDTAEFNTFCPFPTVTKQSPEFSSGYWRGTVWLDQACFAIMALRKYHYYQEADNLTLKLFHHCQGLLEDGKSIRENYNALTGEGMNAHSFSWSAAHILMILWNEPFID